MNIADFFAIKAICEKSQCCKGCPFIQNPTFTRIFCNPNGLPNSWNIKDIQTMCNNFNDVMESLKEKRLKNNG